MHMTLTVYLRYILWDIYNFSRRFKIFIYLLHGFSQNPEMCSAVSKSPWNPAWQTLACSQMLLLCMFKWPVPWMKLLVTGLSPRKPTFNIRPFLWDFLWTKLQWDFFFLQVLRFLPVSIIPPALHAHWFIYNRRYIISTINSVVE